ncbi:hypothetical protein BJ165DRAFT_1427884 [Panaeolus papilionaceus]|nr:hypothetical protein BJ165DRAFT_1427884 [Panaeolus papilionaceus]
MSSDTHAFEHAFYIGNFMGGILYGVELALYSMILYYISSPRNRLSTSNRRSCIFFSTVMVFFSTIGAAANSAWGAELWITQRNKPGGAAAFIEGSTNVWYETWGSVSVVITIFLGDALLLWRLYIVFDKSTKVIAGPIVAYLVALSLAITQLVIAGRPHGNFFGPQAVKVAVAYYVITICLNILVTILICSRLLGVSKRVALALGDEPAQVYIGVAAILVESAAPYTVLGIMFLVPYALQAGVAICFGQLWSKMSAIAPLLIILRVVHGSAWRQEVLAEKFTALHFATSNPHPESRSTSKSFQLSCVVLREVQVTR